MTLKIFTAGIILYTTLAGPLSAGPKSYNLLSPGGQIETEVSVGEKVTYSVKNNGLSIIEASEISMQINEGRAFGINDKVRKVVRASQDRELSPVVYKKAIIKDKYNELRLEFKEFDLIFRAYDEGVAYRFISKLEGSYKVEEEKAEFRFAKDWKAYIPYVRLLDKKTIEAQFFNSFENIYLNHPLSEWDKRRIAFLPLTVEADNGVKASIVESDFLDYPGMFLHNDNGSTTLKARFAPYPKEIEQGGHNMLQGLVKSRETFIAKAEGKTAFPWRGILISNEDKELLNSDFVWKLAKPHDEKIDFSWIKPGKVAWDWWNDWNISGVDFKAGINNETYKYYIDFAASRNIEYVILDEGWAVNKKADLFQVIPEIDLPMLSKYAAEKGVGLILWAGYWAFNKDIEKICSHYSKMGIKGFKVDFMDRDDQQMVSFLTEAARIGAKYKLLMDFHGSYKPSGLHRTYPNVINFEGVNGLEQMKWSEEIDQVEYDMIIPFIRMLAGPMDYTQGAMRNAIKKSYRAIYSEGMSQGTRCRQLAEYIVFESPLNMLCDSPSNYIREPECTEFIASCPVTWDETIALEGEIGEYIAIARRKGNRWYVGAMTDWKARDLTINLEFLGEGDWKMDVFQDGVNADRNGADFKHIGINLGGKRNVDIHMAPGGGWAAVISK